MIREVEFVGVGIQQQDGDAFRIQGFAALCDDQWNQLVEIELGRECVTQLEGEAESRSLARRIQWSLGSFAHRSDAHSSAIAVYPASLVVLPHRRLRSGRIGLCVSRRGVKTEFRSQTKRLQAESTPRRLRNFPQGLFTPREKKNYGHLRGRRPSRHRVDYLDGGARRDPSPKPQADKGPQTIDELRAAIARVLKQHHVPGCGFSIVAGDRVIYAGGVGKADLAADRMVDGDTMFRIGSITKGFVALALLQLQEQGKLDLHRARVGDLAPDVTIDKSIGAGLTRSGWKTSSSTPPGLTIFRSPNSTISVAVRNCRCARCSQGSRAAARAMASRHLRRLLQPGLRRCRLHTGASERQELRRVYRGQYSAAARDESFRPASHARSESRTRPGLRGQPAVAGALLSNLSPARRRDEIIA